MLASTSFNFPGKKKAVLKHFIYLLLQVGIGDPHCVVFHLPGESGDINVCKLTADDSPTDISFSVDTAITEKLLIMLLNLLKKYLMDDSVRIVDLASQALRVSPTFSLLS